MFEVDFEKGLMLTEIADGVSIEDIKAVTKCNFKVCVLGRGSSASIICCVVSLQVSDNLIPMKQAGQ